jgi:hypothetical protein
MTFTHGGMPALAGTARFTSDIFSNEWVLESNDRLVARMRRIPARHMSVVALEGDRRFDLRPEGWGTVVAVEGDQERYRIERRSWLGRRFDVSGSGFAAEVTSDITPRRWTIRVGGEPVGRIAGTLWSYNRIEAHADIAVPVGALTLMWHVLARPWEAASAPGVLRPIGETLNP